MSLFSRFTTVTISDVTVLQVPAAGEETSADIQNGAGRIPGCLGARWPPVPTLYMGICTAYRYFLHHKNRGGIWFCGCWLVGLSVCPSVGKPIGFGSLSWKLLITGLSYFTCWFVLVMTKPLWFWVHKVRGQGHKGHFCYKERNGLCLLSLELLIIVSALGIVLFYSLLFL